MRDAHWLVGCGASARRAGVLPSVAVSGCCPLPVPGAWAPRLLQHACRGLLDKPVICQPCPLKPFYLKAGPDPSLHELDGPLLSLYQPARTELPDRAAGASNSRRQLGRHCG